MSVKVTFTNGQVVDYPDGVGVSESASLQVIYVNDAAGNVVAIIPLGDIKADEIV